MPKRKMKFVNGIMMPDTEASAPQPADIKTDPLNVSKDQLPIISTQDELEEITQKFSVHTADSVIGTIQLVQDEGYNRDLNLSEDADVIAALGNQLAESNTPIGIMNKYVSAQYVHRTYLVDNSGSMKFPLALNDKNGRPNPLVLLKNAHAVIVNRTNGQHSNRPMTRYEEAEHKIHVAIDDLKNIPTGDWNFIFFNNGSALNFVIKRTGTPEKFAEEAHGQVSLAFTQAPHSLTPLKETIEKALSIHHTDAVTEEADAKTHITILTDGDPTPEHGQTPPQAIESVIQLIKNRPDPINTPIHVWICGEEVKWTNQLDSDCKNVAVIDDYQSELLQVREKQGIRFPYTPGFHNACASLAADQNNKDDLDMVDENLPFTKMQLDNLNGYVMTAETYRYYWIHNPSAAVYEDMYDAFLSEGCTQRILIPESEQKIREKCMKYSPDGDVPAELKNGSYEDKLRFVQQCRASKLQGPGTNGIFNLGAVTNASTNPTPSTHAARL